MYVLTFEAEPQTHEFIESGKLPFRGLRGETEFIRVRFSLDLDEHVGVRQIVVNDVRPHAGHSFRDSVAIRQECNEPSLPKKTVKSE